MKTTEQATRFGIIGILNTAIDYFILNFLIYLGLTGYFLILNQKFLIANIISVAVAMVNSFILNKKWAFKSETANIYLQIIKFFAVSIIGMFVIHQIIFNLLYYHLNFISDFIIQIFRYSGLTFLSKDFILLNFSKTIAIAGSFIWNFIGYKFIVFRK